MLLLGDYRIAIKSSSAIYVDLYIIYKNNVGQLSLLSVLFLLIKAFLFREIGMEQAVIRHKNVFAVSLYELLNPIPFGFFVATLVFDIIYIQSPYQVWNKGASWLITFGLLFAIIPRLINLIQVWVKTNYTVTSPEKIHFWLNALAIIVGIFNAFAHSRDVYAVVPTGVVLSAITVLLIGIANIQLAVRQQ